MESEKDTKFFNFAKSFSETEKIILEGFLAGSYEEGIEAMTLQKVASRSKVAFSTVRYNFSGKGRYSLVDAGCIYVVQLGYQTIDRALYEARQKRQGANLIFAYLKALIDWIKVDHSRASFLLCFYLRAATHQRVPFRNQQLFETGLLRLKGLLHESIGSGVIPAIRNVDSVVLQIHQIIHGCSLAAGTNFDYEGQYRTAIRSIEQILEQNQLGLSSSKHPKESRKKRFEVSP